jgi:hypothetical protein
MKTISAALDVVSCGLYRVYSIHSSDLYDEVGVLHIEFTSRQSTAIFDAEKPPDQP